MSVFLLPVHFDRYILAMLIQYLDKTFSQTYITISFQNNDNMNHMVGKTKLKRCVDVMNYTVQFDTFHLQDGQTIILLHRIVLESVFILLVFWFSFATILVLFCFMMIQTVSISSSKDNDNKVSLCMFFCFTWTYSDFCLPFSPHQINGYLNIGLIQIDLYLTLFTQNGEYQEKCCAFLLT